MVVSFDWLSFKKDAKNFVFDNVLRFRRASWPSGNRTFSRVWR